MYLWLGGAWNDPLESTFQRKIAYFCTFLQTNIDKIDKNLFRVKNTCVIVCSIASWIKEAKDPRYWDILLATQPPSRSHNSNMSSNSRALSNPFWHILRWPVLRTEQHHVSLIWGGFSTLWGYRLHPLLIYMELILPPHFHCVTL